MNRNVIKDNIAAVLLAFDDLLSTIDLITDDNEVLSLFNEYNRNIGT